MARMKLLSEETLVLRGGFAGMAISIPGRIVLSGPRGTGLSFLIGAMEDLPRVASDQKRQARKRGR